MKQLLLVLILSLGFAPAALGQNSCSAAFAPPPTLVQRVQAKVLPARFVRPTLEAEQQAIVEDAKIAFRKVSFSERRAWMKVAERIGGESLNPFKTLFDLHAESEKLHTSARNELRTLFRVLAFRNPNSRAAALDRWTRSETHALALYQIMTFRGLPGFAKELEFLREHNLFFSDTKKLSTGALVTYSFEKEGKGKEITMLYRPAEKTENEWFKESDEDRYNTLFTRKLRQKVFLPATVLAPTSLKPAFISGFSFDGSGPMRSWEITHKGYEISLHRTLSEIKEIAHLTRETHSFHVHAVFEMAKSDPRFESFKTWFKVMNDALYLRGIEEGLHGDEFVGPVELPQDHSPNNRSLFSFVVDKPENVSYEKQKFFSGGLRGTLYGPASSPEYVKLGIELRDTTRNLAKLEKSMVEVSDTLVEKSWEKLPAADRTDYARIITNPVTSKKLLEEAGIRPDTALRFAQADRTVALPFIGLDTKPLFNFKTGEFEQASPEYRERAEAGRKKYVDGLKALQVELDGFAAKGEAVDVIDLRLALRQTLNEWAKIAKPSERFTF